MVVYIPYHHQDDQDVLENLEVREDQWMSLSVRITFLFKFRVEVQALSQELGAQRPNEGTKAK